MSDLKPCRICEGKGAPEHGEPVGDGCWIECESCGETACFDDWQDEEPVDSPMRRERDALRAEIADFDTERKDYLRQIRERNAEIAALKAERDEWERRAEHHRRQYGEAVLLGLAAPADIKAELARYTSPLTDGEAHAVLSDVEWPITPTGMRVIDAAIRKVRAERITEDS